MQSAPAETVPITRPSSRIHWPALRLPAIAVLLVTLLGSALPSFAQTWVANLDGIDGPTFVAVDANRTIGGVTATWLYVAQHGDVGGDPPPNGGRIFRYNLTSGSTARTEIASRGTGNGQFISPDGILVDAATGDLFIADRYLNRVQRITNTGTFVMSFGTTTAGATEMRGPVGLARDGSGAIYVAEHGNGSAGTGGHFISKWNVAGATPVRVWRVGGQGSGNGQFEFPYGIAVSGSDVYVSDGFNARVQRFNLDGVYQSQFSVGGGVIPLGLFVAPSGTLWIAESNANFGDPGTVNRINRRSLPSGTQVGTPIGTQGTGNGQFRLPFHGVLDAATDRVYVADYGNNRVQVLSLSTTPPPDTTAPTVASFTAGTATATSVTYTITFSEPVNGVNAGAGGDFTAVTSTGVTATIGAASPATGPATTYTIPVTFSGAAGGTVRLNLNASGHGITDAAGNALAGGSTGPQITIPGSADTTAPTVASFTAGTPTATSVTYTITFSEPVNGVNAGAGGDFTAVASTGVTATIGAASPATGPATTYTIPVTFTGAAGGTVRLNLNASGHGIADAAGNALAGGATGPQITIPGSGGGDTTPPTVASFTAGTATATSVTYTITFSEAVNGVNAGASGDFTAITSTGVTATIGAVSPATGPAATYTIPVTFTGAAGGTVRLNLNASGHGIADAAGNALAGGATGPQITIPGSGGGAPVISSSLATSVTAGQAFSYTITATNSPTAVTATNLPSGLTFSSPTISGSVAAAGTYNITIGASNASGSDSKTLVLTVNAVPPPPPPSPPPPSPPPPPPPPAGGGGIIQSTQTIVFFPPTELVIDSMITLVASASSGLPVTFSLVSGNATLNGSVLTVKGAGPVVVRATQSGGGIFQSTSTDRTIQVKNAQSIAFVSPVSDLVINRPFTLNATSSSGLPVTYTVVSGNATLDGNVLTPTGPGAIVVRATQAGSSTFAATSTEVDFGSPLRAAQSINLATLGDVTVTSGPIPLSATSSAGLPVSFTITGPARLEGNTLVLTGASGTVTIRAVQSGNDIFNPAVDVVRTFIVRAIGQQVYLGTIGDDPYAVIVSADNSQGVFVTRLAETGEAIVAKFDLDANGSFTANATSSLNASRTISGTITSGILIATVAELGANLTALVQPPTGSTASLAGVYLATLPGSATGDTYIVAGPTGQAFAVAITPLGVTSGTGSISTDGVVNITTGDGGTIIGTVDVSTGAISGTVSQGARTAAFVGLSHGTRRSDRLVNLSSRLRVTAGDASRSVIAGFVVTGTESKQILVRAVGPGLSAFGVQDALANPRLQLYNSAGALVAENDDWNNNADVMAIGDNAGAFRLGASSRDSAIVATLTPGGYTAVVSGVTGTGVALVEVYDASSNAAITASQLVNISTRGFVEPGEGSLIAGFVVTGNAPKRVLVRGIGPSLTQFGVPGALADPTLTIYAADSTTPIAQNNDWSTAQAVNTLQIAATAAEVTAASTATGAFPLAAGSRDAAIVITLMPGQYSAVVSGANNTTGAGLVEVYEISNQ